MAENPIRAAASAESGVVKDTLLEAIVKRFGYTLNVGESLGDVDFDVGEPPLCVLSVATGFSYFLDTTDSTTADDGITCLVSGDGRRYHIEDAASINKNAVKAQQNDPPGSPSVGDAYIVGAAPTGDWAAHATDIAIYTLRGWVFATPDTGITVYNEATGANLQFDENGAWVAFAVAIADGSVIPAMLQFASGRISVEARQNAPPGAVTVGPHYLVGTSGSGDWAGQSNKIAYSTDGTTWSFITPFEGLEVYDKDTDVRMYWDGSAWQNLAPGVVDYQVFTTAGAATWTKPSGLPTNAMVFVQMWGGGGGGGGAGGDGTTGSGGGGGGAYVEAWFRASELGSTVSLNVAGGGNGGSSGANGSVGGNSTFGTLLTAYGGGGGLSGSTGGGGGGALSAGSGATGGNPAPSSSSSDGGGSGGAGTSLRGGAGGGNGAASGLSGTAGGASRHGGGGGAGGCGAGQSTTNAGGASAFAGAGGRGGAGTTNAGMAAGTAPGGGGGGAGGATGSSGAAGARGEIRVTVFG